MSYFIIRLPPRLCREFRTGSVAERAVSVPGRRCVPEDVRGAALCHRPRGTPGHHGRSRARLAPAAREPPHQPAAQARGTPHTRPTRLRENLADEEPAPSVWELLTSFL
jgi:hypothetical protein